MWEEAPTLSWSILARGQILPCLPCPRVPRWPSASQEEAEGATGTSSRWKLIGGGEGGGVSEVLCTLYVRTLIQEASYCGGKLLRSDGQDGTADGRGAPDR